MAEYIERETPKSQIAANKLMAREPTAKRILAMIDDIPAADVAPVVHGRWRTIRNVSGFVACDKCGYWCGTESKYCPDCGAKMDEEELHDC